MTLPEPSDSRAWRVYVEEGDPSGFRVGVCFAGIRVGTAEEAIDYALEVIGELREGWTLVKAWAVLEELVSEDFVLERVRRPTWRRRTRRSTR